MYSGLTIGLKQEFAIRFANVEMVINELKVECIDFQADNGLQSSFEKKLLIEFYTSLHPEIFKTSKKFARKMFVVFASTYIYASKLSQV